MKAKKISWQAIAIVVLALVLIASIALGVSGAWFQDKDSATTEATLGEAVTIRLADTATDSAPIGWAETYNSTTDAFPGDKLLGAVSLVPGSDSASIFRIKIVPAVTTKADGGRTYYDAANDMADDEVDAFETRISNGLMDNADTTAEDKTLFDKYNSYLINNMLGELALTGWTKGVGADTEWYYYDKVNVSKTKIDLFEQLTLSNKLSNGVAEWKVNVSIDVEAIQAANISENADWYDDMSANLKGNTGDVWNTAAGDDNCQTVIAYNEGRLKD